jgi:hypothetical protein
MRSQIGDVGDVDIDQDHRMAKPAEMASVAALPAGDIEDRPAGSHQRREAADPRRSLVGPAPADAGGWCRLLLDHRTLAGHRLARCAFTPYHHEVNMVSRRIRR